MRLRSKATLVALAAGLALACGSAAGPAAAQDSTTVHTAQAGERTGTGDPRCRMALRRVDYFEGRIEADAKRVAQARRRLAAARAKARRASGRKARAKAAKRVVRRRRQLRRARATLRDTRAQLRAARALADAQGCTA